MYSYSQKSVRIVPECIFCGRYTNETRTHILSYSSTSYSIPIPTHQDCYYKATKQKQYTLPLLAATFGVPFFLFIIYSLLEKPLYIIKDNMMCILVLSMLLSFLGFGFLYLRASRKSKAVNKKIADYYDTHLENKEELPPGMRQINYQ